MTNKLLDVVLGWPGLIVFIAAICVGAVSLGTGPSLPANKADCERVGGKWQQTMKSYHSCKLSTPIKQ